MEADFGLNLEQWGISAVLIVAVTPPFDARI